MYTLEELKSIVEKYVRDILQQVKYFVRQSILYLIVK